LVDLESLEKEKKKSREGLKMALGIGIARNDGDLMELAEVGRRELRKKLLQAVLDLKDYYKIDTSWLDTHKDDEGKKRRNIENSVHNYRRARRQAKECGLDVRDYDKQVLFLTKDFESVPLNPSYRR